MVYVLYIVAASGLITLSSAAPISSTLHLDSHLESRTIAYNVFGGDGSDRSGWPLEQEWVASYDEMFSFNLEIMKTSCMQWGVENNSDGEIDILKSAIPQVAEEAGLDSRYLLAMTIQESNACVRAPTTNNGVVNQGLLQAHNGAGSCNSGQVLNPCPADQIMQMLRDGASGTAHGDGLQQLISQTGALDSSKYYKAARMYNSGSIAASGNLGDGITSTFCYASDIANRLTGWVGVSSSCDPGSIASVQISSGSFGNIVTDNPEPPPADASPDPLSGSTPSPAAPAIEASAIPESFMASTPIPYPTASPHAPTHERPVEPPFEQPPIETPVIQPPADPPVEPPTPQPPVYDLPTGDLPTNKYPGASANCRKWHMVTDGEYCEIVTKKFGINQDQLVEWNEGLDMPCTNLWLGYDVCVEA